MCSTIRQRPTKKVKITLLSGPDLGTYRILLHGYKGVKKEKHSLWRQVLSWDLLAQFCPRRGRWTPRDRQRPESATAEKLSGEALSPGL